MNRDRFYARLKDVFFPRLRSVGFTGSGQHFRRVQGEVIHAVNLQGDKYGGGCAINLGIHFTFLPIGWQAALPDEKRIKEVDCEFRRRLTSDSMADHWWRYDDASITPEQSAASLEQTYFTKGEAYFQDYGSLPAILAALDSVDFAERWTLPLLGGIARVRAALVAARIHAHLGNHSECRRFATIGLSCTEGGAVLKGELQHLANEG